MAIARVALDVPLESLFDYRTGDVAPLPGQLVVVPFGRRRDVGSWVELANIPDCDIDCTHDNSCRSIRCPTNSWPDPFRQRFTIPWSGPAFPLAVGHQTCPYSGPAPPMGVPLTVMRELRVIVFGGAAVQRRLLATL